MKRILIAFVFLVVVGLTWYVLVDDATNNVGPPLETERVSHELGFSIIAPKGWVTRKTTDSIQISRSKYARHTDTIQVCCGNCELHFVGEVDQGTFLGKRARIQVRRYPYTSFENPSMTFITIVLDYSNEARTSNQFVIRISLKGEYQSIPDWLLPFVNTLEFPQ